MGNIVAEQSNFPAVYVDKILFCRKIHTTILSPLNPRGLPCLMAIASSPRCFATKKNVLASCLNGISFSCPPGSEPGAL
jgi:hypothetical protein